MATFVRLPSGSWRAVIRRKSRYASQTFALRQDARAWALEAERRVDLDDRPEGPKIAALDRFGGLIDKYVADLKKSGKTLGRTKDATLERLKRDLGELKLAEIDRERIIMFGRVRAKSGAGPATVSMDIGMIKLVMQYCAAVHDIDAKVEPIALGRYALKHLNLIGRPGERDRRPTNSELKKLMGYWDDNDHQSIPMTRIVKFAIATAMRQEEICRITWADLDERAKTQLVRDRKDPRATRGNNQRMPLLDVSGYDAMALVEEQRASQTSHDDRIFPYNHRSISANFTRACQKLAIEDLHFQDLRHEAASRLFDAGYDVEQVALVTGHKDWKMLQRSAHLKPEALHAILALANRRSKRAGQPTCSRRP